MSALSELHKRYLAARTTEEKDVIWHDILLADKGMRLVLRGEYHPENYERLPTGEVRQLKESADLAARLERWGVKSTDFIPGFRITYRELDNVASLMSNEGWSGLVGLDEAVEACVRPRR